MTKWIAGCLELDIGCFVTCSI